MNLSAFLNSLTKSSSSLHGKVQKACFTFAANSGCKLCACPYPVVGKVADVYTALNEPSYILPSQLPRYLMIDLSFLIYTFTSSGDLKSGLLTISIRATPDLFKSTIVFCGSIS